MDGGEEVQSKECVKVAVNIRPLITSELLLGCADCVTVVPGEPQVQIGTHAFTYDHVYGSSGSPPSALFEECVAPLVDAFFLGYNATVLAYGQTGSGKTYTMGTNYTGDSTSCGVIPNVMETIFRKVGMLKDRTEVLIRVSFIEIFKEEVFDLLDPYLHATLKAEGPVVRPAIPSRAPIQIRETPNGGISLAGVVEAEVRSKEEMASYLIRGSQSRATGSTNMNSQSSRSHAIFTICLEQKRSSSPTAGACEDEVGDDVLSAKLHLVDLAGSERAKRTGADGLRFKEGVHINRGLLALGNVISALGDEKKRKEGGHVPYRDSKLTRLLQDSLGGNSKTTMIACISPADTNAEETLNTLKYANRARNIQNKAVINRDPMAAQMQKLRNQLEQLQAELLYCRGGNSDEELQVLRHRLSLLEINNEELFQELKQCRISCDRLKKYALAAQAEKDHLVLKIEAFRSGKSWADIDDLENMKELDLVKSYTVKIQELEEALARAQNLPVKPSGIVDYAGFEKAVSLPALDDLHEMDEISSNCDGKTIGECSEAEEDEKEREHSTLQDKLDMELKELDKRLEQKEAEMRHFSRVDTSVLQQHYERKLVEMDQEKKALQKEIEDLRLHLSNLSSSSDYGAQKLKEEYLQKLNFLEAQVSALKKKQEAQSQLLRQKEKSDEAAKRLQDEIHRIKSQKVQLQQKIKQESEQFRMWKASREKEVLQLKKEGRRNEYEMHKLLALNQRQKMVLQRKTEEAAMATKRLKDLLEAKKSSTRDTTGQGNANGPGIQAFVQTIEHELEVTIRVHEVRSEYERQKEERSAMAMEIARLKEESLMIRKKAMSNCPQTMSPSARNSRISALENMLSTSSSNLVSMASQLSEAEERERAFSGRGRWNQVRSLPEAKSVINHLFNLASSTRCQLRDLEVKSRDNSMIAELKEKVFSLSSLAMHLEAQNSELRTKLMQAENSKQGQHHARILPNESAGIHSKAEDERPLPSLKGPRASQVLGHSKRSAAEFMEDMDTSESDQSVPSDSDTDMDDEDWVESGKRFARGRRPGAPRSGGTSSSSESAPEVGSVSGKDECCSCTKFSTCRTRKCECRAASNECGLSCGCSSSRCANRGGEEAPADEVLVAQGTMLLTNALMETPADSEGERKPRRPLSDIDSNAAKPNAPNTKQRKSWRKVAIQIVPAEPFPSTPAPAPSLPETTTTAPSTTAATRDDVPLRLPRAMDASSRSSDTSSGAPLDDLNATAAKVGGSSSTAVGRGKEAATARIPMPRSPVRSRKAPSHEKENQRM